MYSVKMGYKTLSLQNVEARNPWWWSGLQRIWTLPKAKKISWISLHNRLPVWDNLLKRDKEGPSLYNFCKKNVKLGLQILVKCHSSMEVWSALGQQGRYQIWARNTIIEAWNNQFKFSWKSTRPSCSTFTCYVGPLDLIE